MKIGRMIGIAIAVLIVVLAAAAVLGLFGPFSFDFHIGTGREGMGPCVNHINLPPNGGWERYTRDLCPDARATLPARPTICGGVPCA